MSGGNMTIQDSAWTYDTDVIDATLASDNYGWYERDMLNAFTRYAYMRYKQIRDCVNTRKCKSMSIDTVRERLQDDMYLQLTLRVLKISEEEIHYIVNHAEKYLPYAR